MTQQDFVLLKRRQVLKGMGATLGALALRGFDAHADAPVHFTHGIASGDPLQDRVILWTRVLPGSGMPGVMQGQWQVAVDQRFERIVSEGPAATWPLQDNTVKVDATGLEPGKQYFYRFVFDGVSSPVGRTRTLPEGLVDRFRIGLCSCSNYPQGFFNSYRDMARADLDLVMHVGDYIYEYPTDFYVNEFAVSELGRGVLPRHETLSLEDYRQRYGLYRTDPDLQAAHAAHPWITVWDDHELANDTWRAGAENHNEGDGDFKTRMAIARKVYHEWMPIRTAAQTDQAPIYRAFKVGDLADIIMLDTRLQGRDRQLSFINDMPEGMSLEQFIGEVLNQPERTLLGADQEAWFANQLAASAGRGATWQFVGQQVLMGKLLIPEIPKPVVEQTAIPTWSRRWIEVGQQLAPYGMPLNLDAWDGYPAARQRAFDSLLNLAANPVVVAGDTHNAWAFNLATDSGDAVGIEVGCPGINSPGIEAWFPVQTGLLERAFLKSSPELVALDCSQRGWAQITLTPDAVTSSWRFVSTVLSKQFSVAETPALKCSAGARKFS